MARCFHIYDSGLQCVDEAIETTDFCDAHQKVIPFERLEDYLEEDPWRKFLIRLIAFLLLITLLIPFWYTLKSLYRGTPAQAQDSW
jgi:hypothetical protein